MHWIYFTLSAAYASDPPFFAPHWHGFQHCSACGAAVPKRRAVIFPLVAPAAPPLFLRRLRRRPKSFFSGIWISGGAKKFFSGTKKYPKSANFFLAGPRRFFFRDRTVPRIGRTQAQKDRKAWLLPGNALSEPRLPAKIQCTLKTLRQKCVPDISHITIGRRCGF